MGQISIGTPASKTINNWVSIPIDGSDTTETLVAAAELKPVVKIGASGGLLTGGESVGARLKITRGGVVTYNPQLIQDVPSGQTDPLLFNLPNFDALSGDVVEVQVKATTSTTAICSATLNAGGDGASNAASSIVPINYAGDFKLIDIVNFAFQTGAAMTSIGDGIFIYKDDDANPIIPAGATLTSNFASETNVHQVKITLNNGYIKEADYIVVLRNAIVGGEIVTITIGLFSIENRFYRNFRRHNSP